MKIINIDPKDLIQYENNNKIHGKKQIDIIQNSINDLGFRNPVIVDEKMVILAGHARTMAAIEAGIESIPVIIYDDMTKDQKKEYRLSDNRISDLAERDRENIKLELFNLDDENLSKIFTDHLPELDTPNINTDDNDDFLGTGNYENKAVETSNKNICLVYDAETYIYMVNSLEEYMIENNLESIADAFYYLIKTHGDN